MSPDREAATVEGAVAAIRAGGMVVVVGGQGPEHEGDLVMAASLATPAGVNFMATHGRGLICVPMLPARLAELRIPPMASSGADRHGPAFHVGVDLGEGATIGLSAGDRARTIRALADPAVAGAAFAQPGHVFPLAARSGGVLTRAGHAEASVDLTVLAGLPPAAAICKIAARDGELARLPELEQLAREHRLPIVAITDLIAYRHRSEPLVERVSEATMPIGDDVFRAVGYLDLVTGQEHLALALGDVDAESRMPVRMHSECLAGDVLRSTCCDCGRQLRRALRTIAEEGRGVLIYVRDRDGRGTALLEKLHPCVQQSGSPDGAGHTSDVTAARRDDAIATQILSDLLAARPVLTTVQGSS